MHGELMEFNELIHRQLNAKEALLKRLQGELIDLRGPVCSLLSGPFIFRCLRFFLHISVI